MISPGDKAWVGLLGYVFLAEFYLISRKGTTMTRAFGDALLDPTKRWPTVAVWGILTMHLHRVVLPELIGKIDPIHVAFINGEKLWYNHHSDDRPTKQGNRIST